MLDLTLNPDGNAPPENLPEIPFKGEIFRQFRYLDGDRYASVILVKLESATEKWVCWVYDHKERACFWGHYGAREFAESKFEERVEKRKPLYRSPTYKHGRTNAA